MPALNQACRRACAQHRHQANPLFRLPGKLDRLSFQLLPETVAMQRVTADARPDHRHQRQLLTQTQLARQTRFIEQTQRAVGHFRGIAELQQLTIGMHPHRQRAQLGTFKDKIQLLVRQLEILTGGHLELNQADIIMAGDNSRAGAGRQHALNARGALLRRVATAQLQIDIATGDRLKGTGVQDRSRQARQLAGFIQAQQRQQARILHFTRIRAVDPGHIAPDSDARRPGQGTNLGRGIVRTITPQQDGFPGAVARDEAGHHQTFVGMLRHQLLQQRIRQTFIHLRLRSAFGAQEATCVKPCRFQSQLVEHRGHQTCRPHFAMADHFSIDRIGHAAIQQAGETL